MNSDMVMTCRQVEDMTVWRLLVWRIFDRYMSSDSRVSWLKVSALYLNEVMYKRMLELASDTLHTDEHVRSIM